MTEGLVPEDFDLDDALAEPSSTPDEERDRCPFCGSQSLRSKGGGWKDRESPEDNYCTSCKIHVPEDEVVRGGECRAD